MTIKEILMCCGYVLAVFVWSVCLYIIAYKRSFSKGYDEGVEVGLRRQDRRDRFNQYESTRLIKRD